MIEEGLPAGQVIGAEVEDRYGEQRASGKLHGKRDVAHPCAPRQDAEGVDPDGRDDVSLEGTDLESAVRSERDLALVLEDVVDMRSVGPALDCDVADRRLPAMAGPAAQDLDGDPLDRPGASIDGRGSVLQEDDPPAWSLAGFEADPEAGFLARLEGESIRERVQPPRAGPWMLPELEEPV